MADQIPTTEEVEEIVQETDSTEEHEIDEVEETEVESGGGEDDSEDEEFDLDRAKAKIRKVNREAENLRKRLKDTEGPLAELKKLQDAQKSDSEKVADRISSTEKERDELRDENNRLRIQMEFGLTDAQVKRLTGSNLDELRTDAEDFVEENNIKTGSKKPAPSAKEVSGGREPKETVQKIDPTALAEKVKRR